MAKKLSNASQDAAAAIDRLTGNGSGTTTTKRSSSSSSRTSRSPGAMLPGAMAGGTVTVGSENRVAVQVPGLLALDTDSMVAMLPKFDPDVFKIDDPLNPPETLPQATVEQHVAGMQRYEGAQRALDLFGGAFDTTTKVFDVVGKQAKTVTAGFNALTSQEKARGGFLDYLTQQEVTQQKGLRYQLATHQTQTETQTFPYAVVQLDEKLEQAKYKAELAQAQTVKALGDLTSFQLSIGHLLKSADPKTQAA